MLCDFGPENLARVTRAYTTIPAIIENYVYILFKYVYIPEYIQTYIYKYRVMTVKVYIML